MTEHPTILITAATKRWGARSSPSCSASALPCVHRSATPTRPACRAALSWCAETCPTPASLAAALEGVGAVFLVWPFTAPEAAIDIAPGVVQAITEQGRRIVYLSAEAAARQPERFWGKLERLVEHSAVDWTILRPTGFGKNQEHPHVG